MAGNVPASKSETTAIQQAADATVAGVHQPSSALPGRVPLPVVQRGQAAARVLPCRLALIQLYSEEQSPSSSPFSIEVLKGHVLQRAPGWETSLHVLSMSDLSGPAALAERLRDDLVDVVGISVPQGTLPLARELLSRIDAADGPSEWRPLVLLGNSLPTYHPESFLRRFPRCVVVRGFGEDALLSILSQVERDGHGPAGINLQGIPNVTYVEGNTIKAMPAGWPQEYAVPYYLDTERFFARVETSRGCHHNVCTFCTRPPRSAGTPRWFRYPVDAVVSTVDQLKRLGVKRFTFCDEDFIGNDPDGCFRIAAGLRGIGGAPPFSISTRADNVFRIGDSDAANRQRRELFGALREVGLSLVFVGCESFCDTQLRRYGKRNTAAGNIRALEVLNDLGLAVESGLIIFDPFTTTSELMENIANIDRHELWRITSQTLSPLDLQENTTIKRRVQQAGLLGAYDENRMVYAYTFKDPAVAQIVKACTQWKSETNRAYRLVRNAQRMALFDAFPNDIMTEAKRLNFEFLKSITRAVVDGGDTAGVVASMVARRRDVIVGLLRATQSPSVHDSVGEALRLEITRFLESDEEAA